MLRPRPSHMMLSRGLANFTVQASPSALSASASYGTTATTGVTTVSQITGPASILTYSWAVIAGGSGLTINSPTAASTTVSATAPSNTTTVRSWTIRCTVTNSFGQTAVTDVTISITGTVPPFQILVQPNISSNVSVPGGQAYSRSFTASIVANGAPWVAPYTYTWVYHSDHPGSCGTGSATVTGTTNGQPTGTTAFQNVTATITDSAGHSASVGSGTASITWT